MLENEEMLEALQEMNMFSDVFFKEIVRNIECASYVLESIVPDAIIKESFVQKEISNPIGRGIRTDLLLEGIDDTKYNIEVQNLKISKMLLSLYFLEMIHLEMEKSIMCRR